MNWFTSGAGWIGTKAQQVAVGTYNRVKNGGERVIDGTVRVAKGIGKTAAGAVTGDWHKAGEGLKEIVNGGIKTISAAVDTSGNVILIIKPLREIPRLCRGGSRSFTFTGVHR